MTSRLDQRRRFNRVQRQFTRARRHRELLVFQSDLQGLVTRTTTRKPPPRPNVSATAPPGQVTDTSRAFFDQAMRDLLIRVHGRPLPEFGGSVDAAPPPVWWSPQQVYGFRVWRLIGDWLHGARMPWRIPEQTARCLHRWTGDGPYPHDASECGSPPCGIYALKDPEGIRRQAEAWFDTDSTTVAVGTVVLTGRVAEHASGYRAEHAEATGLGVISGDRRLARIAWFETTMDLTDLFDRPQTLLARTPIVMRPTPEAFDEAFARIDTHTRKFHRLNNG